MTFELSDSLKSALLNALENQDTTFVVDAARNELVEADSRENQIIDEEKYYSIPEWTSENGFRLRQDFAEGIRSPLVHDELMEVLHSGRGVFRNFRNVLKSYPEADKLWHKYKNQKLLEFITEWYNSLREVWGLEKLDQIPESDENLIHDDFTFEKYSPDFYHEVRQNLFAILDGSNCALPVEVSSAFQKMWQNRFEEDNNDGQSGFICHSLSDDFAGCILVKPVCDDRKNVILVTNFFVSERFRGLGIGTELVSMCVSSLKSGEEKWLVMPNIIIPETIKPLLVRTGFVQIDFGFLLKI
ncbi:MAG: GNAT family N-acetyltransferase [Treponema sp.]|nr:GNAT family N-acetyltransferase [Treponema sp.]